MKPDRRLKPIYDHLNNGNYKKLIHEVDKLSRKEKDMCSGILFIKLLTLKTIGLCNSGKRLHAINTFEHVLKNLSEEHVAQDFSFCDLLLAASRECRNCLLQRRMFDLLYDSPNVSSDLIHSALNFYIIDHDYKKQQQISVHLSKLNSTSQQEYLYKAALSLLLQSDREGGNAIYIKLADCIMKKCSGVFHTSSASVLFQLDVFTRLKSGEEGLQLLAQLAELNEIIDPMDVCLYAAKFYSFLGCLGSQYLALRAMVLATPDCWNARREIMELYLTKDSTLSNFSTDKADELFLNEDNCSFCQRSTSFISQYLQKEILTSTPILVANFLRDESPNVQGRADRLQVLEYSLLRFDRGLALDSENTIAALTSYIENYGYKPVGIRDIRPYFFMLKSCLPTHLVQVIKSVFNGTGLIGRLVLGVFGSYEVDFGEENGISRTCFSIQMMSGLGVLGEIGWRKRYEIAQLLFGFVLTNDSKDSKEKGDGSPTISHLISDPSTRSDHECELDSLLITIVHILLDFESAGNDEFFLSLTGEEVMAVSILFYALKSHRSSSLLVRLCRLLQRFNLFEAAAAIFSFLEIKNVQFESLAYLLLEGSFHFGPSERVLDTIERVWKDIRILNNEADEALVNLHQAGAFDRIIDVSSFAFELRRSLTLRSVGIQRSLFLFLNFQGSSSTVFSKLDLLDPFTLLPTIGQWDEDENNYNNEYIYDHRDKTVLYHPGFIESEQLDSLYRGNVREMKVQMNIFGGLIRVNYGVCRALVLCRQPERFDSFEVWAEKAARAGQDLASLVEKELNKTSKSTSNGRVVGSIPVTNMAAPLSVGLELFQDVFCKLILSIITGISSVFPTLARKILPESENPQPVSHEDLNLNELLSMVLSLQSSCIQVNENSLNKSNFLSNGVEITRLLSLTTILYCYFHTLVGFWTEAIGYISVKDLKQKRKKKSLLQELTFSLENLVESLGKCLKERIERVLNVINALSDGRFEEEYMGFCQGFIEKHVEDGAAFVELTREVSVEFGKEIRTNYIHLLTSLLDLIRVRINKVAF